MLRTRDYGKFEAKASGFSAGMKPTIGQQPPEITHWTAHILVSTTGKNWRLDWDPPGRRRLPDRFREGVFEAVATRQSKSDPRPLVPAHRGTKGRQADGTARARTQGNLRLGASPPSLRDERHARCTRIPRPSGRRTRHTPSGADVSRTNPVSPRRTPSGKQEVANGDVGPARCPALESSRFSAGRMSKPTNVGRSTVLPTVGLIPRNYPLAPPPKLRNLHPHLVGALRALFLSSLMEFCGSSSDREETIGRASRSDPRSVYACGVGPSVQE